MAKTGHLVPTRCARLRELVARCESDNHASVKLELYSFGFVGNPEQIGVYDDVENFAKVIESIKYDGGTDVTKLSSLVSDLAARETDKVDAMLVFTDGIDSLGRTPAFAETHGIGFPVHCIADGDEVNMTCLRNIVSASARFPGVVFAKANSSYVPGVLVPLPVLRSIKTDQSDDAFVEEFDDGFRCVPDYRLATLNLPIGTDGLPIAGILKHDGEEPSSVSKLIAEVVIGEDLHEFHFSLQETATTSLAMEVESHQVTVHQCRLFSLARVFGSTKTSGAADPARVLGHVYAEQLYAEADSFGLRSGMNMETVREELAIRYGFCSPESSLLMLYEGDQFLEHGIFPPVGHPACRDDKIVAATAKQREEELGQARKLGEIGQPKTDEAKANVLKLAQNLKAYFTTPWNEESVKRTRGVREAERGLVGSRAERERAPGNGSRAFAAPGSTNMFGGDDDDECDECDECAPPGDYDEEDQMFEGCAPPAREDWYDDDDDLDECEPPGDYDEEDQMLEGCAPPARARPVKENKKVGAALVIGAPQDPKQYVDVLENTLKEGATHASWHKVYKCELDRLGGVGAVSPSFYLTTARVLVCNGNARAAIRVASNCLETCIENVQMLRIVAYLLLSTENSDGLELAIEVFDKVRDLEPCEPQSFLDASLVRFWKARKLAAAMAPGNVGSLVGHIEQSITTSQDLLAHVLTHSWCSRFNEVEWPALVLLHYVADFVKDLNDRHLPISLSEWPKELANVFQGDESLSMLRCEEFDCALCVWLGWDTDNTDVDLHVLEPTGDEVYYGRRRGKAGGLLSRDLTQGYGPEIYLLKDVAREDAAASVTRQSRCMVGEYRVFANYFSSHQDSALTGATSAVVWSMMHGWEARNEIWLYAFGSAQTKDSCRDTSGRR